MVEIEPIVKSLHGPVLLLPEENVLKPFFRYCEIYIWYIFDIYLLEPARPLDPLPSAVHGEPELGQEVLKLSLGLGEQPVLLEEVKGLLHHLGLHHLVEQGILLAFLLPCSVLGDTNVGLIILVKIRQSTEGWLSEDSRIPDDKCEMIFTRREDTWR